ncbi:MAG: hypothetical protein JNK15_00850, partial [Planctomycetes bacterium]|nr:hypothetical protein [Planctomycetota bacterium]
ASDRIYTELYRDPRFVALTRRCVCVGASVFRHNARDFDDDGRRIPCPRFGEVTCGEHMAQEPVLWDRYLNDGERVAPRHRLVGVDGKTVFDLALCFDLQDITRALAAATDGATATSDGAVHDRAHRQRLADELAFGRAPEAELRRRLTVGPVPEEPALRQLLPRLVHLAPDVRAAFAGAVRTQGLSGAIGGELCRSLQRPGSAPDAATCAAVLDVLARLEDGNGAFRLFANTQAALAQGAPTFAAMLAMVERVTASGERRPKGFPSGDDPLPAVDELDRELGAVEALLQKDRNDATLHARFAKASLDLARQYMASGRRETRLLFEDAEAGWQRALARDANQVTWWIERARTAYFREDTLGQLDAARRALAIATKAPFGTLPTNVDGLDAAAVEALRWLGDAVARRLGTAEGQTSAAVHEGFAAHGLAAASAFANAKDHVSFVSYCLALACWREATEAAVAGAARFPGDVDLRGCLAQALEGGGASDLGPACARRIAALAPGADGSWFVGQADVAWAEAARRADRAAVAVAAYEVAAVAFAECARQNPAYADACAQRRAACAFGEAMALVRTDARMQALGAFERALRAHPATATALRDGLGHDVLDVVDRLLEWRDGNPSPITATQLHEQLRQIAPNEPFWPTAIADAAIREALRADGRNLDKVERDTVDAGGKPIRMPMGRATGLGDAWLVEARTIARAACAGPGEVSADATTALAQACVLWAERQLERGRSEGLVDALFEAARTLGLAPLAADADAAAIAANVAALRTQLGPARPKLREGR